MIKARAASLSAQKKTDGSSLDLKETEANEALND